MQFKTFGLSNTENMFIGAMRRHFAIPAFNAYNMETVQSIVSAARLSKSPVIIAISESALKYMGDDMLMGIIGGLKITPAEQIALHLDHGSSIESCMHAINIGFSSVMLDFSKRDIDENITATANIVRYAHARDVSVESELGILSGIEDETTYSTESAYTDPNTAKQFVDETGTDSLAIAIGTSHGAYKRKSADEKLRFDILDNIQNKIPTTPLVLHGASSIPTDLINNINKFGGKLHNAMGIDVAQLEFAATKTNICKINIDSDLRLCFTSAVRETLATRPEIFNPREYLSPARDCIRDMCIFQIRTIFHSNDKI
ncbi:MAG: ketose-bisphosphate aldolase [Alphaproteobacteria bacterium]